MKRIFAALFVTAAVVALANCSLRYDFTECQTNDDCERVEGGDEFLVCISNSCVPSDDIECRTSDDCDSEMHCEDNRCISPEVGGMDVGDTRSDDVSDMSSEEDADAMGVDMGTPCVNNTECADDEICAAGTCATWESEDCEDFIGPRDDQNTVTLGAIIPTQPPYDNIGEPLLNAVRLAVKDFNRQGPLPGGRKVTVVACDDSGNSQKAQRAAAHLAHNLGVPAIVGPLFSTPFTDVVLNVTRPAEVFTITPTATAPSITLLDDRDLAWRTISSDVIQGNAIVDRLTDLQEAGDISSVTILYKDDAYGNGLFEEISVDLMSLFGSSNFTGIKYDDPADFNPPFHPGQTQAEFQEKVGVALQKPADLVLLIGTTESVSLAGAYIQSATAAMIPLPSFMFSHGAVADMSNLVSQNETLQPLIEGIAPDIFHPTNFEVYRGRYDAEYPGEPPLTLSTLTYDAMAVTMLAMATVDEEADIIGRDIVGAMAALVDGENGTLVSYSDSGWASNAVSVLRDGGTIDFIGVSGDLDFDLTTGEVRSNYLSLVSAKDDSDQYNPTPVRVYALAPDTNRGMWFVLCDPDNPTCPGTHQCLPLSANRGICVPPCDPADPMCPMGLSCMPVSQTGGLCVPPSGD